MSKNKIVDESPRTGVFEGDLRYGRCNGNKPDKHGDYSGPANKPVSPLTLVKARDPECWTKDPRIKKFKKLVGDPNLQSLSLILAYKENEPDLKSNIHLTVGKRRFTHDR